ncbi:hypothetical protein [Thiomonas sp. X19]|uniref:hypothetical protein n=1 Tax=Thiomonas sp. X19 TaxID=1050370 RepID=UPI0013966B97|nr:hypothetical protein [Thiomonas sp. X19]
MNFRIADTFTDRLGRLTPDWRGTEACQDNSLRLADEPHQFGYELPQKRMFAVGAHR